MKEESKVNVLVAFLFDWLKESRGRSMPTWDSLAADDDETTLADAVRAAAEELGLAN